MVEAVAEDLVAAAKVDRMVEAAAEDLVVAAAKVEGTDPLTGIGLNASTAHNIEKKSTVEAVILRCSRQLGIMVSWWIAHLT